MRAGRDRIRHTRGDWPNARSRREHGPTIPATAQAAAKLAVYHAARAQDPQACEAAPLAGMLKKSGQKPAQAPLGFVARFDR